MITTILKCDKCDAEAKTEKGRIGETKRQGYKECHPINFQKNPHYSDTIEAELNYDITLLLCPDCQKLYDNMRKKACDVANEVVEEFFNAIPNK